MIAVLFLLLGNLRAALITAAVIPLSMLLTVTGMVRARRLRQPDEPGRARLRPDRRWRRDHRRELPAALRRAPAARSGRPLTRDERFELPRSATAEVIRPSLFGVAHHRRRCICRSSRSTGVEGKMFHPMAHHRGAGADRRDAAVADVRAGGGRAVPAAAACSEHENRACPRAAPRVRAGAGLGIAPARGVVVVGARCWWRPAGLLAHAPGHRSSFPSLDEGDIARARAAHPRHQPRPRRCRCRSTLEAAHQAVPRSGARVRQDRHRRDRHRSDAAVGRRHLRHAEAARAMARSAQAQGELVARDRDGGEADCRATTTSSPSRSRCA